MNDYVKYPVILGAEYIHVVDEIIATLESCDVTQDKIRLKCLDSPWIFESNHATFAYYWKLK
jgi:hypothetical protein